MSRFKKWVEREYSNEDDEECEAWKQGVLAQHVRRRIGRGKDDKKDEGHLI